MTNIPELATQQPTYNRDSCSELITGVESDGSETYQGIDIFLHDNLPDNVVMPDYETRKAEIVNKLKQAIDFFQQHNIYIPPSIRIQFSYMPGSGSDQRSRIYPDYRFIEFDLENDISIDTVIHEMTHLATPWITNLFLDEGLACYMEEIYTGQPKQSTRVSTDVISGDAFARSSGSRMSVQESVSYEVGYYIWQKIGKQNGQAAVIALVSELSLLRKNSDTACSDISSVFEQRFEELTGKRPDEQVRSQSKKAGQENFGFLNSSDAFAFVDGESVSVKYGASLAHLGHCRFSARLGLPTIQYNGELLKLSDISAELAVQIPHLYPLRWNSNGLRIAETSFSLGSAMDLNPYVRAELVPISYGHTNSEGLAWRLGAGITRMVYQKSEKESEKKDLWAGLIKFSFQL